MKDDQPDTLSTPQVHSVDNGNEGILLDDFDFELN